MAAASMPPSKKRVEGMPSKSLMVAVASASTTVNRLSMLRSVMPRIIKNVDPGDAIDYMKALLERMW
ncbi:hypothetical protein TRIUR3_35436 [Triticum urartu]|uniref:Uncharacterized protein n=1 Tax=Triticum urartu TaxID=4572 RepID=M7YMV5_TRIUA|nr:hypothetical protein TRIUR3_35436 [Triticum urartu]